MNSVSGAYPPIPLQLPYAWGGPLGSARLRVQAEDFQVFEVPVVEPCGEGEHCWLYIRKRNSNTEWVARQLARFAGVSASAVSYAGLKDRNAVTEQWFSVQLPGRPDPEWRSLPDAGFAVLAARRHSRKLKKGALRGNRFRLRLRNVDASAADIDQRMQQLATGGFPNCFGAQRFGHAGTNLLAAERLFKTAKCRLSRHKRGIYLSAVRSALFNRVLAARIDDACWNTAIAGDALQLDGKSACFVARELDARTLHRVETLEVHPTGPLCGVGEELVTGSAAHYEAGSLQPYADWIAGLQRLRVNAARRALRVVPGALTWEGATDGSWVFEFSLPAGSYATALLREIFDLEDRA